MKKTICLVLILIVCAVLLCSCDTKVNVPDGVYRVEFDDFDKQGYKDYIEFSVEDGTVRSMVANAVDKDGNLKTESVQLRSSMESVVGTYPEKYYRDLVNEYIGVGEADEVDVIAGATLSSNDFVTLMKAVEKAIKSSQVTDLVIVERD